MELWIRSQDRRILIKVNNIYYNDCEDFIDICTTYYDNRESSLGIYKKKERALEVLKEIQDRIINLQLLECEYKGKAKDDINKYKYLECVYQMPEE